MRRSETAKERANLARQAAADAIRVAAGKCAEAGEHRIAKALRKQAEALDGIDYAG